MNSPPRAQVRWRLIGLTAIVLFFVGTYSLGSGLVPAVPLVYGGSEEEAAQRDAGLIRLVFGCGLLALLGVVLARVGASRIGVVTVAVSGLTSILGVAGLGWSWLSAVALVALALGGTTWALRQWGVSRRPGP